MVPRTNLELIRELYRAFREKDDDAFRAVAAPDIEWIQNRGFPNGAVRRGADAVIEGVFEGNRHEWEGFSYAIEEMLDAGSSVLVIGRYEGVHRRSRKAMKAAAAHLYDIKDGRVTRFRMFADTKTIWDAMG